MKKELEIAKTLGEQLKTHQLKLAVAESCTGGSLAAALTEIPGSSHWFDRGFVTYSNHAKKEILGVSEQTLHFEGAVSEATVTRMAEGAIQNSDAHLSVSISGIAGPGGSTQTKPIGTVWIAWSGLRQPTQAVCYTFSGDRTSIRQAAVLKALEGLLERTKQYCAPPREPNYFFALWPDNTTKNILFEHAKTMTKETTCKPSLAENLHLTLAYLGPLSTKECATLLEFNCPVSPFELNIAEIHHWSRINLAYFSPKYSESLEKLHAFLTDHLLQKGFKPERHVFVPHITFARDYQHALDSCTVKPTHWFVHEFCLVKSIPNQNDSHYEIVARTPLTLKTC